MAFQHKPNRGSVFRNDRRNNENSPTHRGDALIDGVEYWISAWVNETKDGSKYFSLAFDKKEKQENDAPPPATPEEFDDDIPF